MTQVCHTAGLWDYLPSFLQRAASPIVELLVDDMRGALYARTANSEVQAKRFLFASHVPQHVAVGIAAMLLADDADRAHAGFDARKASLDHFGMMLGQRAIWCSLSTKQVHGLLC